MGITEVFQLAQSEVTGAVGWVVKVVLGLGSFLVFIMLIRKFFGSN